MGVLAGAALVPAVSYGAVTYSIVNEGVPTDPSVGPATGYTAYLLTLSADNGDVISEITAGSTNAGDTYGFFGPLLQDYEVNRGTVTSDPNLQVLNNQNYSIDSHFYVTPTVSAFAPFENTNATVPAGFPYADDAYDQFGTGTYLRGSFAISASSTVQLAYVVVKNGAAITFNIQAAEGPTSTATTLTTLTGTIGTPFLTLTAGTAAPSGLTQLTTANTTFSPNVPVANSINVTGKNGGYAAGFATVTTAGGVASGYVETSGFSPSTDSELYAIKLDQNGTALSPTDAQVQTIVNDINAFSASDGVVASRIADSANLSQSATFGTYDILLTSNSAVAAQDVLAFNFGNEPNVSGLTVTNIAAIPEPASLAVVSVGAAGLLAVRRRRARDR